MVQWLGPILTVEDLCSMPGGERKSYKLCHSAGKKKILIQLSTMVTHDCEEKETELDCHVYKKTANISRVRVHIPLLSSSLCSLSAMFIYHLI